jgi:hypothetical protein
VAAAHAESAKLVADSGKLLTTDPQIAFKPMGGLHYPDTDRDPSRGQLNDDQDFYTLEVATLNSSFLSRAPLEFVRSTYHIHHNYKKDTVPAPTPTPSASPDSDIALIKVIDDKKVVSYCWIIGSDVRKDVSPYGATSGHRIVVNKAGSVVISTLLADCSPQVIAAAGGY